MLFSSTYPIKIDEKGRAGVPKAYRESLTAQGIDQMVVTFEKEGDRPCLELIPLPVWEAFLREFLKLPQWDRQNAVIRTFKINPARTVPVDSAGRVLIPPKMREWAKLDHEAIVIGVSDRFQIWNEEQYNQVFADAAQAYPDAKNAKASELS